MDPTWWTPLREELKLEALRISEKLYRDTDGRHFRFRETLHRHDDQGSRPDYLTCAPGRVQNIWTQRVVDYFGPCATG